MFEEFWCLLLFPPNKSKSNSIFEFSKNSDLGNFHQKSIWINFFFATQQLVDLNATFQGATDLWRIWIRIKPIRIIQNNATPRPLMVALMYSLPAFPTQVIQIFQLSYIIYNLLVIWKKFDQAVRLIFQSRFFSK